MESRTTDLEGRICMLTGATSGIGKAAAHALARSGATLVLVGRDRERCERTVAEIVRETGNSNVESMLADLSSQKQIRQLVESFLATGRPLHILFNNAGVILLRREETADGIERTFATDHLAYFLLTRLLLERLTKSGSARVVNTASDAYGYSGGRLDFDDLESRNHYSAMKVYGKAKLANILFTHELARRSQGKGVTANCFHPGFVGSDFARNNGLLASVGMRVLRPFIRSPEKGAETGVYLCTSPKVATTSGAYFYDCKPKRLKSWAQNDEDSRRLWEESERMTGTAASA